jgi:DHA1 family bicyclomycin/chloramphenicol resistance-like MFS transporter
MVRPETLALTALLALLTAVGPLSVDLYLPSLPEIARTLDASAAEVQLTLSGFLVCFAFGQIIYGPISDHVGRKPVLLTALGVYAAACIGCALAQSIETLIVLRALQALGVAGVPVLARAIVRDLYQGARIGRELSRMGSIMALAPIVAPLLGGIVQSTSGWRAVFAVMVAVALAAIVVVLRLLPETMNKPPAEPISFSSILRSYRVFVRNRTFLIHAAILTASYAGLFAWISGSSFTLQSLYGLSPFTFGLTFGLSAAGYLVGSLLAARFVVRLGIDRIITLGGFILASGGIAMVAAVVLELRSPLALAVPIAVYLCGLGFALPQAMAGALMPFADRAGAASSLLGFLQQTFAAALGILVGQTLGQSALPLALVIAAMGCLALALALCRKRASNE